MWVVEMRDYPNGPPRRAESAGNSTSDDTSEALGRVVVLEDKNRDGFFETSTVLRIISCLGLEFSYGKTERSSLRPESLSFCAIEMVIFER